jgi:hypothetical protein
MTDQDRIKSTQGNPGLISIEQLSAVLNGRVIAPGDADYDKARTVFVELDEQDIERAL